MSTVQGFYSVRGFRDFGCHQLQLEIICFNKNALEVKLINLQYNKQRSTKLKKLAILIGCYLVYKALAVAVVVVGANFAWTVLKANWTQVTLIDLTFMCLFFGLLSSTLQIVKSEKLLICTEFGLQLQIVRFLSRESSIFIPSSHIYDVCINEVIEDLDIHYILILRTKGSLYSKKPIISIFNTLKPEVSCLVKVFKYLTESIAKEDSSTKYPGVIYLS